VDYDKDDDDDDDNLNSWCSANALDLYYKRSTYLETLPTHQPP